MSEESNILIREKEADVFALCLLMPEDAFRYWWNRKNGDAYAMGRIFGVEPSRALRRAELINEQT